MRGACGSRIEGPGGGVAASNLGRRRTDPREVAAARRIALRRVSRTAAVGEEVLRLDVAVEVVVAQRSYGRRAAAVARLRRREPTAACRREAHDTDCEAVRPRLPPAIRHDPSLPPKEGPVASIPTGPSAGRAKASGSRSRTGGCGSSSKGGGLRSRGSRADIGQASSRGEGKTAPSGCIGPSLPAWGETLRLKRAPTRTRRWPMRTRRARLGKRSASMKGPPGRKRKQRASPKPMRPSMKQRP